MLKNYFIVFLFALSAPVWAGTASVKVAHKALSQMKEDFGSSREAFEQAQLVEMADQFADTLEELKMPATADHDRAKTLFDALQLLAALPVANIPRQDIFTAKVTLAASITTASSFAFIEAMAIGFHMPALMVMAAGQIPVFVWSIQNYFKFRNKILTKRLENKMAIDPFFEQLEKREIRVSHYSEERLPKLIEQLAAAYESVPGVRVQDAVAMFEQFADCESRLY